MKYVCKTEGDKYFAVIESDGGKEADRKEYDTKFAAMTGRDEAENAGVSAFADIGKAKKPAAAKKVDEPKKGAFDHEAPSLTEPKSAAEAEAAKKMAEAPKPKEEKEEPAATRVPFRDLGSVTTPSAPKPKAAAHDDAKPSPGFGRK